MRISDSPRTRAKAMCDWVLELMQGSAEHESQCGMNLLRESIQFRLHESGIWLSTRVECGCAYPPINKSINK